MSPSALLCLCIVVAAVVGATPSNGLTVQDASSPHQEEVSARQKQISSARATATARTAPRPVTGRSDERRRPALLPPMSACTSANHPAEAITTAAFKAPADRAPEKETATTTTMADLTEQQSKATVAIVDQQNQKSKEEAREKTVFDGPAGVTDTPTMPPVPIPRLNQVQSFVIAVWTNRYNRNMNYTYLQYSIAAATNVAPSEIDLGVKMFSYNLVELKLTIDLQILEPKPGRFRTLIETQPRLAAKILDDAWTVSVATQMPTYAPSMRSTTALRIVSRRDKVTTSLEKLQAFAAGVDDMIPYDFVTVNIAGPILPFNGTVPPLRENAGAGTADSGNSADVELVQYDVCVVAPVAGLTRWVAGNGQMTAIMINVTYISLLDQSHADLCAVTHHNAPPPEWSTTRILIVTACGVVIVAALVTAIVVAVLRFNRHKDKLHDDMAEYVEYSKHREEDPTGPYDDWAPDWKRGLYNKTSTDAMSEAIVAGATAGLAPPPAAPIAPVIDIPVPVPVSAPRGVSVNGSPERRSDRERVDRPKRHTRSQSTDQ